jgi:hypothetical protein
MLVAKPFRGELINIWRFRILRSVTADPGDAVVFAGDPENVGPILGTDEARNNDHAAEPGRSEIFHSSLSF